MLIQFKNATMWNYRIYYQPTFYLLLYRELSGSIKVGLDSNSSTLTPQPKNKTSTKTADEYLPYQSILSKYSSKYASQSSEGWAHDPCYDIKCIFTHFHYNIIICYILLSLSAYTPYHMCICFQKNECHWQYNWCKRHSYFKNGIKWLEELKQYPINTSCAIKETKLWLAKASKTSSNQRQCPKTVNPCSRSIQRIQ